MVNKEQVRIGLSVCLLTVAIVLIVLGVLVQDYVDDQINEGVASTLKLTPSDQSENSSSWYKWEVSDKHYLYHAWNYTNIDDVINSGAKPAVTELGPYDYLETSYKFNIEFDKNPSGGDEPGVVSYNVWWKKESQTPTSATDMVTTMNPIYWGIPSTVYAGIKGNAYSALVGAGLANASNIEENFPVGVLGDFVVPQGALVNPAQPGVPPGVFIPPTNTRIAKSESIVGVFAAPSVLGGLHAQVSGPSLWEPAAKFIYFPGYIRSFVQKAAVALSVPGATAYGATAGQWAGTGDVSAEEMPIAEVASLPEFGNFTGFEICPRPVNGTCPHLAVASAMFNPDPSAVNASFSAIGEYNSIIWAAASNTSTAFTATSVLQARGFLTLEFMSILGTADPAVATASWSAILQWMLAVVETPAFETYAMEGFYMLQQDSGLSDPVLDAVFGGSAAVGGARPATFVELGFQQITTAAALGGVSLDPSAGSTRGPLTYAGFEFALAFPASAANAPKWDQMRNLLSPTIGFGNSTIFNSFAFERILNPAPAAPSLFGAVMSQLSGGALTAAFIEGAYGVTQDNAADIYAYCVKYLAFHLFVYDNLIAQNYGAWHTVKVEQLLLGMDGPAALVAAFGSGANSPGVVTSYEGPEDLISREAQGKYALYMGTEGRLDQVRQYFAWRGVEEFTTVNVASGSVIKAATPIAASTECIRNTVSSCLAWKSAEVIKGSGDGTHYKPYQEDEIVQTLPAFISEGMRVIELVYERDSEVKGIKTRRYIANANVLKSSVSVESNDKYRMSGPDGLAPVDLFFPVPAVVSRPHFWEADPVHVINKITGMNPSEADHTTYIELEPLSGAAVFGAKRFQNNLKGTPEFLDWEYHANVFNSVTVNDTETGGPVIWFPWYWGTETDIIMDDDASDFRKDIYDNRDLSDTLAIVFLVTGIALAAASILMLIFFCHRRDDQAKSLSSKSSIDTTA